MSGGGKGEVGGTKLERSSDEVEEDGRIGVWLWKVEGDEG